MENIAEVLGVILLGIIGFVIIVFIIIGVFTPFMMIQCGNYTNITGTPTRFSIIQMDCFVNLKGKWIPYEKWVNISGSLDK